MPCNCSLLNAKAPQPPVHHHTPSPGGCPLPRSAPPAAKVQHLPSSYTTLANHHTRHPPALLQQGSQGRGVLVHGRDAW